MWQHANCFQTFRDPGFADAVNKDFTLKESSVVYKALPGFLPVPFGEIGLKPNNSGQKERWLLLLKDGDIITPFVSGIGRAGLNCAF
jgi:hypothetical protein